MKTRFQTSRLLLGLFGGILVVLLTQMSTSAASLSAIITNRWSFYTNIPAASYYTPGITVTDSVAGQVGQLVNDAYVDGTELVLDGTPNTWMTMTNSLLTNLAAVTFEAWITDNNLASDNVGLFGFGNSGTGANNYIRFVSTEGGDNSLFELASSAGVAGLLTPSPGLEGQTVHLSLVYNPAGGLMAIYTNGVLRSSGPTSIGLTNISYTNAAGSFLGRGPWDQDSALVNFNGDITEFRVWNGALSPLDIVSSDLAGPTTLPTSPATVSSISLSSTFQETVGAFYQASVQGTVAGFPNPINITAAVSNFTSGNTNVLTVSSTGLITTHNQGSTTLVATYGALSATNTISVAPAVAYLTNRWSFGEPNGSITATDSVSGAVGTCLASGTNYAYITNGSLLLGGGTSANPGWFSMPGGLVTGLQTVTFEAWITTNAIAPDNVGLFEFSTGVGNGGSYLRYVYHDNGDVRSTYEITSGSTVTVHAAQPAVGGRSNEQHVAIIYDPNAQVMAIFTNGVLLSVRNGTLPALSNVPTNESGLGQSPWHNSGDPYFAGAIDDFRIYSGTLTPQKVAMSYLAGPNASSTALDTNDPGPLTSVSFAAPSSIVAGLSAPYSLFLNYANLSNFDIAHNSYTLPVPGLTVTSGNTNIISVLTNGTLLANNAGTAVIRAVYQGVTNNTSITVVNPPVYGLIHRYSFASDASDSIGGANGTLMGNSYITNGGLYLDGVATDYVSLPGGLISGLSAVTLEAWYTAPSTTVNGALFAFNSTNSGTSYIRFVPFGTTTHTFEIQTAASGGGAETLSHVPSLNNGTWHVTCVYDPTGPLMAVYTNGVIDSSYTGILWPLTTIATNISSIGLSPWSGDPGLTMTLREYRIYSGRLAPVDIATTQILGPNALTTPTPSLGAAINGANTTLTWPQGASGFSLVSSPVLGIGAVWTPVTNTPTLVGENYQLALPHTGAAQYFRLRR